MTTGAAKKASHQDWHPADIKAALHKKGITLAGIAEACGMRDSTSLSSTFTRSYPLNEQRIAAAIGVPVQDIWPSRYHADGTPKPRGFRAVQFNAAQRAAKGNLPASRGRKAKGV